MNLTPEQLEERIPILRAACAGKVVQVKSRDGTDKWKDAEEHDINFYGIHPHAQWRFKPEEPEVPGEVFVNIYPDGPVGAHKTPGLADAAASPHRLACRRYVLAEEAEVPEGARERWIVTSDASEEVTSTPEIAKKRAEYLREDGKRNVCILHVIEKA